MSSAQIVLDPVSTNAPKVQSRIPVHISFTAEKDVLVMLWETGYLKLTDLHTRLGPGQGRVMDPEELWTGFTLHDPVSSRSYRQVLAIADTSDSEVLQLAALSSESSGNAQDVLSLVVFRSWNVQERCEVALPQRNGRLIPSDRSLWWQAPDGEILSGAYFTFS